MYCKSNVDIYIGGAYICTKTISGFDYFTMKVTSPDNTGSQMKFECDNGVTKTISTASSMKIIFDGTNDVFLSNYIITAFLNGSNFYTKSGLMTCVVDDDCLMGYMCNSGKCTKCHSSCSRCSQDSSSSLAETSCDLCNALTDSKKGYPDAGKCVIDYIDLSQFNDITINSIDPPSANRVTLGFWVFISDTEKMGQVGGIVHIVVKNFFIISITGGNNPTVYLISFEKYHSELSEQTSADGFLGLTATPSNLNRMLTAKILPSSVNLGSVSGRWFFIQGAMSFHNMQHYIKVFMEGGYVAGETKSLPLEELYPGINNDEYFRTIFRARDTQTLQIKNAKSVGTHIYFRNMVLFQEFMPTQIFYMYHDVSQIMSGKNDWPEVIYVLPFTNLLTNLSQYQIKGGGVYMSSIINLEPIRGFDLSPPVNFKQLPLNSPNTLFSSKECNSEQAIGCNGGTICYDQDKPISCPSFMTTTLNCDAKCDGDIKPYPGIRKKGGICAYRCTSSMNCLLQSDDYFGDNDPFCLQNSPNYNLYYKCTSESTNYALFYSSLHNTQNIVIDVSRFNLKSYFVELWYYPDFTQDSRRILTITDKHYVFYTNSIRLYLSQLNKYIFESGLKTAEVPTDEFSYYEWNKIIAYVKYEKGSYNLYGYINNNFNQAYYLGTGTSIGFNLQMIFFCNGHPNSCNGNNIKWGSGFYKDLRVWDGDRADILMSIQYDQYFPNYSYRMDGIKMHLPLSKDKFANNVLYDSNGQVFKDVNNDYIMVPEFRLQLWNYSSRFDYIASKYPSLGKIVSNGETMIQVNACLTGCARCWGKNGDRCYSCFSGYYLNERTCKKIANYYFKAPQADATESHSADDIKIVLDGFDSKVCTMTFWVKLFGFSSYPSDLILYKDNGDLKLHYENDQTSPNYGLNLMFVSGTTKLILSNIPTFRENFGEWTYFSLANYNSNSDNTKGLLRASYFPKMIKFEVNADSYPIDYTQINNYDIEITHFIISQNVFGLFHNLKVYSNFIVGSIGYELNKGTIFSPFYKPEPINQKTYLPAGSSTADCYQDTYIEPYNRAYECVPDYDIRFDKPCTVDGMYMDYNRGGLVSCQNCHSSCTNSCHGGDEKHCTCLIDNSNSQFFVRNGGAPYCKQFDYINWAMAKDMNITNVLTAKMTKKYTMQFWFYAYSYKEDQFKGLQFIWNLHNKIEFNLTANGKYTFYCFPFYDENGDKAQYYQSFEGIHINKWNFLSCAVDFTNVIYYINTNNDNPQSAEDPLQHTNPLCTSSDRTYLSIKDFTKETDREEWGVLFYRQIRLWTEAYFSAEFLSRIIINTPSLFPYLANEWEPKYNKDGLIVDVNQKADDANVINEGGIGTNIVDIDANTYDIKTCSENGEYYDVSTETCLQFTDLSKMNDFEFENLPVSYSGNYAMGFWVFVEDIGTLTRGVHLQWKKHLQISVLTKNSELTAMCFPQGYYADSIDNTDINSKYDSVLNKFEISLGSISGKWEWVLCSVSNYNRGFFMNNATFIDFVLEKLYEDSSGSVYSDYPLRYFMSEVGQTSTLSIQNIANTKKIYLRAIELFQDYIPFEYSFQYMDLSKMGKDEFPSLLFVVNFATFKTNTRTVSYVIYNSKGKFTNEKKLTTTNTVTTFELSANFVFLPLCNPEDKMKYDEDHNKCVPIVDCDLTKLNAKYCMDEKTPLTCLPTYYISAKSDKVICDNQCSTGETRAPGTPANQGICTTSCTKSGSNKNCPSSGGALTNFPNQFTCQNKRINYKCYDVDDERTALFYSRCYQPPNIYRTLTSGTRNKFSTGYFFEFWFKIDSVLNNCDKVYEKEYYLYSYPHSLYVNSTENKYYYEVISTPYKKQLGDIQQYEWNRIVLKTVIGTSLQHVFIYVNYDFATDDTNVTDIPSSVNMLLKTISFCSSEANGDCSESGTAAINWGSAYYRNFRVWDLKSSSTQVIQAYNNGMFEQNLKSLILFYPMTISHMDVNVIEEIISGKENIVAEHADTKNFYSSDNYLFYNYATNYDWGIGKEGQYINAMAGTVISPSSCDLACKRCYSNSISFCYECKDGYVLINQECITTDKFFLKTPAGSPNTVISLKITEQGDFDLTLQKKFTIAFWMKFLGVIQEGTSSEPFILKLSQSTYLAYDITSTDLIMRNNNKEAFRDTNFHNYYGKWISVVISDWISNDYNDVFPNMFTLAVNKIDIPFSSGYTIPSTGISVNQLSFGFEIVALFAELRVYSPFIQGAYGHVTATNPENKILHTALSFKLYGPRGKCLDPMQLASGTIDSLSIQCALDYNDYLDGTKQCNDKNKYLDLSLTTLAVPCGDCLDNCKEYCFNDSKEGCTCDVTYGQYWLRRNRVTKQTYCEYLPYIDFSELSEIIIPQKDQPPFLSSDTPESTLEVWVFVYSYNTQDNNFNEIDIAWDYHNKITIINKGNSLYAQCYPLTSIDDPSAYTEYSSLGLTFFKWNLVRCGTDLFSDPKANKVPKFFLNGNEQDLATPLIGFNRPETSRFKIHSPSFLNHNYGFVFLREIKLWKQYNFRYIDSSYINLKSFDRYPGLLYYIKSQYTADPDNLKLIDEITKTESIIILDTAKFEGYNIIDPDNSGYYSTLTICEEGFVYSSATSTCIAPALTKCLFPGDINDNCITCEDSTPYLNPIDGSCVSECPDFYYENKEINQCRKCYHTCFKCFGNEEKNCLSCTNTTEYGVLYYYDNMCVENCEAYGKTASIVYPNMCADFEVQAIITNYDIKNDKINVHKFVYIEAEITGATSNKFSTQWSINEAKTLDLNNNDPDLIADFKNKGSPFINETQTDCSVGTIVKSDLVPEYFRTDMVYVITLTAIQKNGNEEVLWPIDFIFTMNKVPFGGGLKIIPEVGLYNTTTFVMSCENWDDDTNKSKLTYKFFSIEENTSTEKPLSDWSGINEIFNNFTVVYYQQASNKITVYCQIRDEYLDIVEVSQKITISNSINNGVYSLAKAMEKYVLPQTVTSAILLARSEYLKSLGLNTYKTLQPELFQTKYEPALDQSIVTKRDPTCTSDYCNYNGECDLVDEFIVCKCEGYVGRNCHVDKTDGYQQLENAYNELYNKILGELQSSIDYDQFRSLYNLFFSAQMFIQDPTFFSNKLDTYLTLAMNLFSTSILNNTIEYFDLFDFYYQFELTRLNKDRLSNKISTGYPYRNVTLTEDQTKEYAEAFTYISNKLLTFLKYLVNLYKNTQKTLIYESRNLFIGIQSVNPTFSDTDFFEDRKTKYKTHIKFMDCLNYVEIEKLTNPYYNAWMIYIEYLNFPYGYNSTLSENHTSPVIDLKFIDATTGKDIIVSGCEGDNSIKISMPFNSYAWLDDLNRQKWLYDPNNYKSPDDPIFSDPIYINASGYISNDTIEERISIYKRLYNFSCTYYDTDLKAFNETGLNYLNFTSDGNYIEFNSSHLTLFTTFFKENKMEFHVLNRFFYLRRPQVFKYWPNYTSNYAFFILGGFIGLYIVLVIILSLYDMRYFRQESLLEFLKREIVRVFLPYNHNKEVEINKRVPSGFAPGIKPTLVFNSSNIKSRRAQLEQDKYLADDFGTVDEKDPNNIFNLNKIEEIEDEEQKDNFEMENAAKVNSNENLDSVNNTNANIDMNGKPKNKFFNAATTTGADEPHAHNGYINENDMYGAPTITQVETKRGKYDPNELPEDFDNKEEDYQKRLEAFANLNLSFCQFIGENMRERHIFISPIINISLFNPRWKKMIMLVTEIAISMILISVQLTADENATTSNLGSLIKIAVLSVLGTDVVMYILPIFFYVTYKQRKRLYQLVVSGGQLIVLKEWEDMICHNGFYTTIGVIINFGIWGFAFYISISFVAVWSYQASAWLITWIVSFFMDFILFEFLVELIIGLIYIKRKNSSCPRVVAEFLNRARNYRCLWP